MILQFNKRDVEISHSEPSENKILWKDVVNCNEMSLESKCQFLFNYCKLSKKEKENILKDLGHIILPLFHKIDKLSPDFSLEFLSNMSNIDYNYLNNSIYYLTKSADYDLEIKEKFINYLLKL